MNVFDLIVLLLLAGALIQGYQQGFVRQVIALISYILSIWVAFQFTDDLAPVLSDLWDLKLSDSAQEGWMALLPVEKVIYSVIAFFILLIGVRWLLSIAASLIDQVANLPILHSINKAGGAILGVAKVLLVVFILVNVLGAIPWSTGQEAIEGSMVAHAFAGWTPDLSQELGRLFQGKAL